MSEENSELYQFKYESIQKVLIDLYDNFIDIVKDKRFNKITIKKEQIEIKIKYNTKLINPFDFDPDVKNNPFENIIFIDMLNLKFVYNNEVFKFQFIPNQEDFYNFGKNNYTSFCFDVHFKCFNIKNTFQLKYYYDTSYLDSNPLEQAKLSNKWFMFFEKDNRDLTFHKDNFIKLLDIFIHTNFTLERDKLLHSIIKLTFPNNTTSDNCSYDKKLEYLRSKCDDIKTM